MEENIKNDKVFNSNEYKTVTLQNIMRTISVLKATGSSFQIRVPKNKVGFSPLLSKEIEVKDDILLFDIDNYSLDTFSIDKEEVSFQAAFGPYDFEATVAFDTQDIFMVLKDHQYILATNYAAFIEDKEDDEVHDDGINKSMFSFMNNKENEKFFKK